MSLLQIIEVNNHVALAQSFFGGMLIGATAVLRLAGLGRVVGISISISISIISG